MKNVGKNGEAIGLHQADELIAKLEKAGLTKDFAQQVIASKDNALARKMMAAILPEMSSAGTDLWFEKLAEFEIKLSEHFSLDKFQGENKKKFYGFNSDIIDCNFKPSYPLMPGNRQKVLVYRAKKSMTSEDCLNFIASQNGKLPNAQGLAIAWQQASDKLPEGVWILSFDKKENLLQFPEGRHKVPILRRDFGGDWLFVLGHFDGVWDSGSCVIFFRDCA